MTRRELASLFVISALPLKADPASDAWNVIAAPASDLADDNVRGFLKLMDAGMPGLEKLTASVQAMIAEPDVVTVVMRRQGKKWVILEFGPVEFFAPPNFC